MGRKIYANGEEENPGEMMMEASVLPEQHGDEIQPYYGLDPNNCLRFCNKLVQSITMDLFAHNRLTRQLDPKLQQLENNPANRFMAERHFLMNKVHSIRSQLESLKRDSRSVSGVNTCFLLCNKCSCYPTGFGYSAMGRPAVGERRLLCK